MGVGGRVLGSNGAEERGGRFECESFRSCARPFLLVFCLFHCLFFFCFCYCFLCFSFASFQFVVFSVGVVSSPPPPPANGDGRLFLGATWRLCPCRPKLRIFILISVLIFNNLILILILSTAVVATFSVKQYVKDAGKSKVVPPMVDWLVRAKVLRCITRRRRRGSHSCLLLLSGGGIMQVNET